MRKANAQCKTTPRQQIIMCSFAIGAQEFGLPSSHTLNSCCMSFYIIYFLLVSDCVSHAHQCCTMLTKACFILHLPRCRSMGISACPWGAYYMCWPRRGLRS